MNNGVQHKLINYEVTPPPGVWDKIAAELDESELHHVFPSALYQAEVTAPAGTWNKIEAALDEETVVIIPKRRAIVPWIRYAAAAVLLGFIAWGGVQLLNSKQATNSSASSPETNQPENRSSDISAVLADPVVTDDQVNVNSDKTDDARDNAALEASKKTYAKLDVPVNSYRLKNIASAYHFASGIDMTDPGNNYAAERYDLNNRYIVMMTPDGHFVRMAKKLSNMICCVSGEEQDKECVDQMSRWKEKIACSPTGHSTGSFLDILSLIKSLDDQ